MARRHFCRIAAIGLFVGAQGALAAAADLKVLTTPALTEVWQELGPKFARRAGGYTRILKTGHRKGDGAEMARIELVEG